MANVSRRRLSLTAFCSRARRSCSGYRTQLRLSIEPTPFAKNLDRALGPHGLLRSGTPSVLPGNDVSTAQLTLETWLARKRKRGYRPTSEPAPLPSSSQACLQLKSLS